jgi:hypothetical protein
VIYGKLSELTQAQGNDFFDGLVGSTDVD